jgi:hypothetical protein
MAERPDVVSQWRAKRRERDQLEALRRQDERGVEAKTAKSQAAQALLDYMTEHERLCIPIETAADGLIFLRRKDVTARHNITQAVVEQAILTLSDTDGHAALRAYCSNKGKRRKLEQGEMEMDEDYARRVREERSLPLAEVLAKSVRAKVDAVVAYQRATLQLGPSKPRQFDLETEQITEEENELFRAWQAANNDVMDTTEMYTDDIKVLNDEIEDLYAQVADVVDAAGLGANEVRSYRAEEADAIVTLARNVKRKPPRPLGITACYDLVLAPLAANGAEGQDVEEVFVDASARDWQADYADIFAQYCSPEFLQAWAAEVGAAIEERAQQREEYTQVEASIAYYPRPDDGVAEEE